MKKLIVVFKTHLDLGFTGFSGDILNKYMRAYIPSALDIAKKARGTADRFVWTTGSWLLEQYLEHCSKLRTSDKLDEFIEAVENGDIRWHALPFTTHTELMTKELFEYGVSISEKLDNRFGFKTIAAKMTDVPGHTKAMIPLLVKAGVKFLHIGVNPASAVPKVPELFKWRYDDENEIVVMYNGEYGEFTEIPGTDSAVYFAHTGDNNGPQSTEQISEMYKDLRNRYPDVEIVAGTLEDVAAEALKAENLPVITSEIGDSWIHGTASSQKGKRLPRSSALCRNCRRRNKECNLQKPHHGTRAHMGT